jgi:hypothetical protein
MMPEAPPLAPAKALRWAFWFRVDRVGSGTDIQMHHRGWKQPAFKPAPSKRGFASPEISTVEARFRGIFYFHFR